MGKLACCFGHYRVVNRQTGEHLQGSKSRGFAFTYIEYDRSQLGSLSVCQPCSAADVAPIRNWVQFYSGNL